MPTATPRLVNPPGRIHPAFLASPLFLLLVSSTLAGEGRGIVWRTDLAAAQSEARARNLPLWIQFTGPWCIYCKRMDFETFTSSDVITRSRAQFIPVKLRSDMHEDLVSRLGVTSLPTTVVLSPSGSLILAKQQGFSDAERFANLLDGAWSNFMASPDALALSGFCPVKLVQGKGLVAGDASLAIFHDGHIYRFSDRESRELFLKDAEKYLPANRGRCVVAEKDKGEFVSGDPKFGAYYHDHLYLFADDSARMIFAANPDKYSDFDVAQNGECPHCRIASGKIVAGKPEFPATLGGRRYLFPDDSHRQAFRAAPERYLR